jgi:hypothetical protein
MLIDFSSLAPRSTTAQQETAAAATSHAAD